jgi:hypothetical protein
MLIREVEKAGDIKVVERGNTRNAYTLPTGKAMEKQQFQGLRGTGMTTCIHCIQWQDFVLLHLWVLQPSNGV